jgi:hypothetical protein
MNISFKCLTNFLLLLFLMMTTKNLNLKIPKKTKNTISGMDDNPKVQKPLFNDNNPFEKKYEKMESVKYEKPESIVEKSTGSGNINMRIIRIRY